jgi:predicted ATPase/DNA-binding SARP family transcriptional activator
MFANRKDDCLTIRLFGGFEALRYGAPLPRTRSRKEQWLLAYLILRHPSAQDRDHLATTFWPESLDEAALANLRRSLKNLRRVLGADAYRITAPGPRTVGLNLADVWVDVLEFDPAIDCQDAEALERALSLYRGPLLEGCTEEWVFPERGAREDACVAGLERLAAEALVGGEPGKAVRLLHKAVGLDPLRESAHRELMKAFAAGGDYAAMDRQYRDLRLYLRREVNAEPAEETAALYREMRAAGRANAPLTGVEPTVQANRRLPCPLTRLIGRQTYVDEVAGFLQTLRLVTLTGSGGVGKTRLAIAVAEQTAAEYTDGVWFVDLAPLSNPALIAQAVASTLGIHEEPAITLSDTLQRYLQKKSLLLILDNCEHLVEACVILAEALLEAGEGVRILATSREALGIGGESVWRVPSLAVPDESALDSTPTTEAVLGASEALQLFVERATQVDQGFRLTADNLRTTVEICRHLDGIPLAIELAAARLSLMDVSQIAARLEDRFHLLSYGRRSAFPRHQTLRATMDWSYDLLTEAERRLLNRLSVFAGGFTLESAEKVCSGGSIARAGILDLLARLVDKSLVMAEACGTEKRYRMLETIRRYARERLSESEETAPVRNRHRDYFLALAESAEQMLTGPEQGRWTATLVTELDNLRTALDWCQAGAGIRQGLRIAGALFRFWYISGNYREVLDRLRVLLDHPDASDPTEPRAKTLKAAGIAAYCIHDYDAARSFLEEAVAIRRILDDPREIASDLSNLSMVLKTQGDAATARSLAEEALSIMRALGDDDRIANILNGLGYTALSQGDLAAARGYSEEALAVDRARGNTRSIASTLDNLGDVARMEGECAEANLRYSEALQLAHEVGDRRLVAQILEGLARLAANEGVVVCAARLLAAQHVLRESLAAPIPLDEREAHEAVLEVTRSGLSESAFADAWEEGLALTIDQVIEDARTNAWSR